MRVWWKMLTLSLAAALLSGASVRAGGSCGPGGCGGAALATAGWDWNCWWGPLGPCYPGWLPDPWAPSPWPTSLRVFPRGGFTAYPPIVPRPDGTLSPYRQIIYPTPPAETARQVRERLAAHGIPPGPPRVEFLGKNPAGIHEAIPLPPLPKEERDDKEGKPDDRKPDDKGGGQIGFTGKKPAANLQIAPPPHMRPAQSP